MRILLIEDDTSIRTAVGQILREQGYAVDASGDGTEGLWYATGNHYDLVILDLMLPGLDGLELLRRLRAKDSGRNPSVLIISARDGIDERIRGLDLGADDYLVKPFAIGELLARTRCLVRRRHQTSQPVLELGGLRLDPSLRQASWLGQVLSLTPRELSILEYLLIRVGTLVSRSELWEHIYAFHDDATSNVIDHFIAKLRRKLTQAGAPALIHTRRGQGYVLALADAEP